MELTVDEALKKGVEAHQAGQTQEAEELYSFVLNAQPNHPDANHNMGVLVVSVNKADAALPLFKTALEAKPYAVKQGDAEWTDETLGCKTRLKVDYPD